MATKKKTKTRARPMSAKKVAKPVTYIDKGDVEDHMRACVSNHLPRVTRFCFTA